MRGRGGREGEGEREGGEGGGGREVGCCNLTRMLIRSSGWVSVFGCFKLFFFFDL